MAMFSTAPRVARTPDDVLAESERRLDRGDVTLADAELHFLAANRPEPKGEFRAKVAAWLERTGSSRQ